MDGDTGPVIDQPLAILDPASPLPPYEQVAAQVRRLVASGRLPPGAPLPSVRQLAGDLGIAPNTVVHAYRELEAGGWVVTQARRGVVVARPSPRLAQKGRRRWLAEAVTGLLESAHEVGIAPAELSAEIDRQLGARGPDRSPRSRELGLSAGRSSMQPHI